MQDVMTQQDLILSAQTTEPTHKQTAAQSTPAATKDAKHAATKEAIAMKPKFNPTEIA